MSHIPPSNSVVDTKNLFDNGSSDLMKACYKGDAKEMRKLIWMHFTEVFPQYFLPNAPYVANSRYILTKKINAIGGIYGTMLAAVCAGTHPDKALAVNLLREAGVDPLIKPGYKAALCMTPQPGTTIPFDIIQEWGEEAEASPKDKDQLISFEFQKDFYSEYIQ